MSPSLRSSSASVASESSSRLRSRITDCDCCGSDHRFGSATFFSISANCARSLVGSKIAPQISDLLPYGSVFAFFDGSDCHCSSSLAKAALDLILRTQNAGPQINSEEDCNGRDNHTQVGE